MPNMTFYSNIFNFYKPIFHEELQESKLQPLLFLGATAKSPTIKRVKCTKKIKVILSVIIQNECLVFNFRPLLRVLY